MKTTLMIIFSLALITLAQADYFAGVVTDQKLATDTTNAINDLKATLTAYFDCSDNSRRPIGLQLGGIVNLGASLSKQPRKLFSIFQTMFKKNSDRSLYTFNNPINKCSFQVLGGLNKKKQLFKKCITVSQLLTKIKEQLKNQDNVVIGSDNTVNGSKNWVVGSKDSIIGDNNWVFTSDLTLNTVQDGVLIIGNYLIELVDINWIPKNPNQAIRCITTTDSNKKFREWWRNASNHRKTCF